MTVDNYLTVMFWLYILSATIRGLNLCGSYPRFVKHELGMDVIEFIAAIFFLAWVCYLRG